MNVKVQVNWNAGPGVIDSYNVKVIQNGDWVIKANVIHPISQAEILIPIPPGVTNGSIRVGVSAINIGGESSVSESVPSPILWNSIPAVPAPPTGVTATVIGFV